MLVRIHPGGDEGTTELSWNMSSAMKTMGRLALCGWQSGSGFSLEEPEYRQLWRLLDIASPTSFHSGLGAVCMLEICDLLSGYLFGHHHCPPLIKKNLEAHVEMSISS